MDIETVNKVLIVVPTYNEERIIGENIGKLRNFLLTSFTRDWQIIVADNASSDCTIDILRKLSEKYPEVRWFHINQAGKGRAIKKAIVENDADIIFFLDADLSTDLDVFPLFIDAIDEGQDVVIGSRLLKGSRVKRSFRREFLSKGYNQLLRLLFGVNFSDAQCGFKALRRKAILELLPSVKDNAWFFDTELLIYSQRRGLKIKELPIKWVERKDSKERIFQAIFRYIFLLCKLRLRIIK